MAEAAQVDALVALEASVMDELRGQLGAAWVEPTRVHLTTKSKRRGDSHISSYEVEAWFTTGVVMSISRDFSGTRRLRTRR